ncbi:hypothetical protein [Cryptosporangium aurantiacum]|uniref:Uncharacterized protein n=1 Tax=Cryptosporangium aurantiacum TaxID=134849 RepID=A0A1M7HMK5_9ACTN|nr:hypothetical protein [Cryptosporangium aurantiacum]SHM29357.1 hypothetical protein SAMN05443668_101225 [Cryptosporangium aurantiacum]
MSQETPNRGWAAAGVLGAVLSLGWAAVAVAFVLPAFTGSPPTTTGDGVALGIVVLGVLLLAAIAAVGARAAWKHAFYGEAEQPRRLMTAGLCTVVIAGWPAVGALTRGADGVLDPTGAAALGLTLLGGITLIVLHRARVAEALSN